MREETIFSYLDKDLARGDDFSYLDNVKTEKSHNNHFDHFPSTSADPIRGVQSNVEASRLLRLSSSCLDSVLLSATLKNISKNLITAV